jgi:pimeloyl-ACP methyl ester carboxylesterase
MDDHITIRGEEISVSDSGSGHAVIWGHGLTSSRADEDRAGLWDLALLAPQRRVVRYDARGHGLSGSTVAPEAYGWDQMALDQLALADALGIDGYVAGGASMGAATALWAAVKAPQRITGLVLAIPPTAWETRAAQTTLYETMATTANEEGVEPLVAARSQLAPPDPFVGVDAFMEGAIARLRAADPTRLARVFRGAATADFPPRELVASVQVPTLILAWTGDPAHPVETAETLHHLMPAAELHLTRTLQDVATWNQRIHTFVSHVTES